MAASGSKEIEEILVEGLINIRKKNEIWNNNRKILGSSTTQELVGGVVKSYRFNYAEGQTVAHGHMYTEFGSGLRKEYAASFLILKDNEANDGLTGERIVEETLKLSGNPESVVEAYFSTYCKKIRKWIVVYERFEGYLLENTNMVPAFFASEAKRDLTDFWRNKIRSLLDVLDQARVRHVVHGNLANGDSYVISSGTVKLINIARYRRANHDDTSDIEGLDGFLRTQDFSNARSSAEWMGLSFLLNSEAMSERDWKRVVMMHPILVVAEDKLTSYEEVHTFMWRLKSFERERFANALYCKMRQHIGYTLYSYLDMTRPVHLGLYKFTQYTGIIYLEIINFMSNMISHANDYVINGFWGPARIVQEIQDTFGGYMSMAYAVSKTKRYWNQELFNDGQQLPYRI
ncbi:uncharacterized protein LOC119338760 [Triticum dicoccoides]|uniref:uncharacterized protein LOC119338760 n=1 Tax=Triticum dicoccoides TaxID=85692 RepID=UPI001890DED9|nr:uncharacterized protein LOC119338760 [Triticum dicoccoides]